MTLYTIGFTKKSARTFFSLIKENHIDLLVDIRLNNRSQLAGFTKEDDLLYFLQIICNCRYVHREDFAPTKEILNAYQKKEIDWEEYERQYFDLMKDRGGYIEFLNSFVSHQRVALLCSEPTTERCHRRLLSELLSEANPGLMIYHI